MFRHSQAHLPVPPPRVTSHSGASGQGPVKSSFKPSYFVKYCSGLMETGEADEVK